MGVRIVGVDPEELLRPLVGVLRRRERRDVAGLDQREVVGPQSGGEREREQRIHVLGFGRETPAGQRLGALERAVEADLHLRVGLPSPALGEGIVVDEELGLQNSQPMELGKEKTGRFGDRASGILGPLLLPDRERALGSVEVQAVHAPVAEIERFGRLRDAAALMAHGYAPLSTSGSSQRQKVFLVSLIARPGQACSVREQTRPKLDRIRWGPCRRPLTVPLLHWEGVRR